MNSENDEVLQTANWPLFRRPFFTDWTVLLGILAVGASSYSAANQEGITPESGAGDWFDFILRALLAAGFQGAFWGIAPAALRRRRARKRGMPSDKKEYSVNKYWGLALVVAVLATGNGILVSDTWSEDSSDLPSAIQERCEEREGGTVCVAVRSLGRQAARIQSTWTYDNPQVLDGSVIGSVSWSATVDCEAKTGILMSLTAKDVMDKPVVLGSTAFDMMWEGVQAEQVDVLVETTC